MSRAAPNLRKLPEPVARLLAETTVPWEIAYGSRHLKILVAGRVVQCLPYTRNTTTKSRHIANATATVRRAIRAAEGGTDQ